MKNFHTYLTLAGASGLLLSSSLAFADIYYVKDKNGVVTLTNTPASNSQKVATDTLSSQPRTSYATAQQSGYSTPAPMTTFHTATAVSRDPNAPTNINYGLNQLEYANDKTLGSFARKWRTAQPIVVAHFGDSHIQLGWGIGEMRDTLQAVRGDGGRGMIFPYTMAKTYSQEDFTSSFTGNWKTANSIQQPPKMGVGVSGFVGSTQDSYATVNFDFSKAKKDLGSVKATVYYRALGGNYQLTISNGISQQTMNVVGNSDQLQAVSVNLPNTGRNLSLTINRQTGGSGATFELHGVDLANLTNQNGLVYHNLGVGGAAYQALLQQRFFEQQFPKLNADLVILDWGTNDLIYKNQIDSNLENTIRSTVRKVKASNPTAGIILTSAQEARYKGNNVTVSAEFSNMVRRIAQQEGTAFYDWYRIAGGSGSVNTWYQAGYASKDNIHLNGKGYRLKGDLFANAILNAVQTER